MCVQFELGTRHLENRKQASAVISEIKTDNTREMVKKLSESMYGIVPSEKAACNDYLGLAVSLEEMAKTAPQAASLLAEQVIVQALMAGYGNPGNSVSCNEIYSLLCAEPGGTGLDNLSSKAVRNGDSWHVKAKKLVSREQLLADSHLVFACDEEGLVRVFAIPSGAACVARISKKIAGSEVVFEQLEIDQDLPVSSNVAIINDNFERNLCIARTLIAAVALGVGHSAVVTGITTARETKGSDNVALSGTQSIQFTLADMYAELESARMLTYFSADLIDSGKANIKYATMAKIQATDAASAISMQALQILGNLGYLANNNFADLVKVVVDAQTKGGTNRVQRNRLYQYMLEKK